MKKEFLQQILAEHQICTSCPTPQEVADFFKMVLGILYQDFAPKPLQNVEEIAQKIKAAQHLLENLLARNPMNAILGVKEVSSHFVDQLPHIYKALNKDIMAICEGDPACKNRREVIRSYPGFYGIAAYRIANALHLQKVEDLPRIITEHAHSLTGIDIHPGATIGESFCIDHGTGIVIGETAHIHNHVKIYQGVTLGALSVQKSDADTKRHPTIEDDCVIYAGATILGGQTTIGKGSVIGGNVWITRSVEPGSKIYYQAAMNINKGENHDMMVFKNYAK